MEPMNGFYDSDNDQITLEIDILKVEEKIILKNSTENSQ